MAMETMMGVQLLKMDEEKFSSTIKEMAIKDIMETISVLQKEMAKEQDNFNSLSSELQNFKERNSRQYKQISKDMVVSQQRLTMLMNRSMKCFAQIKGPVDTQNLHNSSNDSPLKRRNSAKGSKPIVTPVSTSISLQRSKSLLAVNQTAASDSSSSFQSPVKSHQASSGNSFQYSVNVSHKPIIMKTTTNGGVKKPMEDPAYNLNDINRPQRVTKNTVSSIKEKESLPASSGMESKVAAGNEGSKMTDTDVVVPSSSASVISSATGGLYVKRKPAQQQRVTTTTNISSSKFLPASLPPSSPVSESASSTSFSNTTTPIALSTCTPTLHPVGTTSISSFVKSRHVAPQSEYVSPLQMAQARKGVSKSQTHIQDTDSSTRGFRGLPSVKLLAQSFGSSTALNVVPGAGANLSSNKPSMFVKTSNVVYKSNSSLNLSEPPKSNVTTHKFVSKDFQGESQQQTPQQESSLFTNGKSQLTKQLTRVPQSSAPSNICSEPTEFEKSRTRLRAVGRDLVNESTNAVVLSTVVAPVPSHSAAVLSENEKMEKSREDSVMENRRVGAYVKRKEVTPGKSPSSVQPTPSVTVQSINSPSTLISSTINSAASMSTLQNQTSLQTVSVSSQSSGIDNSKLTVKPVSGTSNNTAPTKTQPVVQSMNLQQKQQNQIKTSSHFINFQQRQPNQNATSSSITNNAKMSFATLPRKEFGAAEACVSTAAVTIRRSKSREELQQIENDTRTNKDLLLKQIQARKRDSETLGGGSNIRTMSSLSKSMPSLLHDGK